MVIYRAHVGAVREPLEGVELAHRVSRYGEDSARHGNRTYRGGSKGDRLPRPRLAQVLATADVGVVPLRPKGSTDTCGSPLKMFDYLAAGLPTVATVHGPVDSELRGSHRVYDFIHEVAREAIYEAVVDAGNGREVQS